MHFFFLGVQVARFTSSDAAEKIVLLLLVPELPVVLDGDIVCYRCCCRRGLSTAYVVVAVV
jgi:hypothetical protein